MRKLARYPILWLLVLLTLSTQLSSLNLAVAGTVDAYYQFRDYTDSPLNVRRVVITPIGPSGEYSGSFLSQKPINYSYATYPSLTNGYLLATNLITGYAYRVAFSDGFGEPTVTNYFGTNLSGTVGAVTNKTSYIQWVNGLAIQINGPYFNATITNSGSTGGDAILRPSGSISIVTNATGDHTPILNTNTVRLMTSTNLNLLDDYLIRAAGQVTADGDWVFGGALSGDAISSWSIAADGDAEFNDLAATNITANSLAGPVLNQITNIATGSGTSPAQVAAIMQTNTIPGSNVVGTLLVDFIGGDGSGLTGIRDATSLTNIPTRSINRNAAGRVPEFIMCSYNVFATVEATIAATNSGLEAANFSRWATNSIYWWSTNNMKAAGHVAIQFDDGWQGLRTNGVLTWNTNLIPTGIPYIASLAHAQGMKLYLYSAYTTNSCNSIGGSPGVGSPIDKVYADVQRMMSWGADGCKFDTCDPSDWASSDARVYRDYIIRYARIANQAISDFNSAVLATNGTPRAFWVFIPTTVQGPTPNIGTVNEDLLEFANIVTMNWPDASYSVHGDSYLTNIINLAKLSIAARDYVGRGVYACMESFYANGQHNPGGSFTGAGGWTNALNLYQAVCSPVLGTFGMWSYGTITNATSGLNPNSGSPIKILESSGQYWTNREFLEIYRDPAGIVSKVAWSNNLAELWVRPLGHEWSETKAVTLLNADYSNSKSVTVSITDFGGRPNTSYTARDPWTGTETTFQNSFSVTIGAYTTLLWKIYPTVSTRDIVSLRTVLYSPTAGTVLADHSPNMPSPHFGPDGIYMPNTAVQAFSIPIPSWVTNATLVYAAATHTSTANQWTNTVTPRYYSESGRYNATASADQTIYTALNPLKWITNTVSWPTTNGFKEAFITWSVATNTTGNRWIIGPINLEYR